MNLNRAARRRQAKAAPKQPRFAGVADRSRQLGPAQRLVFHHLERDGRQSPHWDKTIVGTGGRACHRCRRGDARVARCPSCPPYDPSRRTQRRRCEACRLADPRRYRTCEHAKAGLSEKAGVCRSTVQRAVRNGLHLGILQVERGRGRSNPNVYRDPYRDVNPLADPLPVDLAGGTLVPRERPSLRQLLDETQASRGRDP